MNKDAVFRLVHTVAKARALNAVRAAPDGCVVTISEPQRNKDQNAKLHAMLTEISIQAVHPEDGSQLSKDVWKLIVMDAFGLETTSVPSLNGKHRVPVGLSTSRLGVTEFSDLIEFTAKVGSELGVLFHDRPRAERAAA